MAPLVEVDVVVAPPCSAASHDLLKLSQTAFLLATEHLGYQQIEGEFVEMRNCRACRSTLVSPYPVSA